MSDRLPDRSSERSERAHPKVSVCIPTWNRARYLAAAIESALRQEFRDLEIIVSDDASSDETARVVESIADKRIRYTRHSTRLGLWGNTNHCVAEALGKYVIVLQDDDAMLPGLVQREVEAFESDPRVVLVHAAARRVDGEGRLIETPPQAWPARSAGLEFVRRTWSGAQFGVAMSSAMFSRAAAAQLGGFNADLLFAADADLWQRLAFQGEVAFLNEPLISVRVHAGQVTSQILLDQGRMLEERLEHAAATRKLLAEQGGNLDRLIRARLSQYIASDLTALRSLDCPAAAVLRYAGAGVHAHPAILGSLAFYRNLLLGMLPPPAVRWLRKTRAKRRDAGQSVKTTGVERKGMSPKAAP